MFLNVPLGQGSWLHEMFEKNKELLMASKMVDECLRNNLNIQAFLLYWSFSAGNEHWSTVVSDKSEKCLLYYSHFLRVKIICIILWEKLVSFSFTVVVGIQREAYKTWALFNLHSHSNQPKFVYYSISFDQKAKWIDNDCSNVRHTSSNKHVNTNMYSTLFAIIDWTIQRYQNFNRNK